jgi:hypothetical protein
MQQALQAGHVIANIGAGCVEYAGGPQARMFHQWAVNHKTIILLNGGDSATIADTFKTLILPLNLPCANFFEDEYSLNNACTCAGIVVPTEMCDAIDAAREGEILVPFDDSTSAAAVRFIQYVASLPLAR